jgi:hypothetical protein
MDANKERAIKLKAWSVNDIAIELGIAKSTAWLWVKHIPLDRATERARAKDEFRRRRLEQYWLARRTARDLERDEIQTATACSVGALSARELMLLGAAIYWCEGTKTKP